ncbi:7012_t:CDS:1, partial [Scutellospora calospora]
KGSYENLEVENNEIENSLLAETSDLAENKPVLSTPYNEKKENLQKEILTQEKNINPTPLV